jgi:hypothetical protein
MAGVDGISTSVGLRSFTRVPKSKYRRGRESPEAGVLQKPTVKERLSRKRHLPSPRCQEKKVKI